nr:unnamed protein product [Callosobruchus chinensis]
MLFLQQNNKVFPELQKDEWWCLMDFLCDITEKLNNMYQSLQDKEKIVSNMANTVSFLKKHYFLKRNTKQTAAKFPHYVKGNRDLTNISEKNCVIILDYITALINEFQKIFQDLRK